MNPVAAARRLGGYAMFYVGLFLFGLFCLLWSIQASGLHRIMPRASGARCGQFAIMSAVRIISRLPRVVCITKASIWDNPFLGGGARLAAYIRNDVKLKLIKLAI